MKTLKTHIQIFHKLISFKGMVLESNAYYSPKGEDIYVELWESEYLWVLFKWFNLKQVCSRQS